MSTLPDLNMTKLSVAPHVFIERHGRRVLTDDGKAGMDGREEAGSTSERIRGLFAELVYCRAGRLDSLQIDEIIGWLEIAKQDTAY